MFNFIIFHVINSSTLPPDVEKLSPSPWDLPWGWADRCPSPDGPGAPKIRCCPRAPSPRDPIQRSRSRTVDTSNKKLKKKKKFRFCCCCLYLVVVLVSVVVGCGCWPEKLFVPCCWLLHPPEPSCASELPKVGNSVLEAISGGASLGTGPGWATPSGPGSRAHGFLERKK